MAAHAPFGTGRHNGALILVVPSASRERHSTRPTFDPEPFGVARGLAGEIWIWIEIGGTRTWLVLNGRSRKQIMAQTVKFMGISQSGPFRWLAKLANSVFRPIQLISHNSRDDFRPGFHLSAQRRNNIKCLHLLQDIAQFKSKICAC